MKFFEQEIKKLGFGLMRLPRCGEEIDVEQTCEMVDRFMAAGCTYFDTAFVYNGSEEACRKALVERYPRESYQLATKIAPWLNCKSREEAIAQFETSLERTGAGYFDNYLLHNLGVGRTQYFDDFRLWDFALEQKAKGKIRHLGFSFHAGPEELEQILTAHPEAEFVQLQINYADWEERSIQSRACYEVARRHGKPVVVMEPVKGGLLANPPQSVRAVLAKSDPNASPASWAVRFAADLDGVLVVLSGMSNVAQMEDNLAYMKDFDHFTPAQRETVAQARAALAAVPLIPCTTCNYCAKVCPKNIGISGTFAASNVYTLYENLAGARDKELWEVLKQGKAQAKDCIRCGACESVCPQHIAIREELARAAALLGQK